MNDPMPPRDVPDKFRVAFSYAGEQIDLVRSIAEAVEVRLGRSTVFFDKWYEAYTAGEGSQDRLQDIYHTRSALAIICVSKDYNSKSWPLLEWDAIFARVNKARASTNENDRQGVLPLRVGEGDVKGIYLETWIVPDVRNKPLDETVALIIDRLHHATLPKPWPEEPTPHEHGLADLTEVWPKIQKLMTAHSDKRILTLKGPEGYGKGSLLEAAVRYANKYFNVLSANVGFGEKQVNDKTKLLKKFRLDLGSVLPHFAADKNLDSDRLLVDLRALSRPVLIVFYAYEKIIETKEVVELIEGELLGDVEKCPQVRFLIAGQKVPERFNPFWRELADEIKLDKISDQQVWREWIHQINPLVSDEHIEGAVVGADGHPERISGSLKLIAEYLNRNPRPLTT